MGTIWDLPPQPDYRWIYYAVACGALMVTVTWAGITIERAEFRVFASRPMLSPSIEHNVAVRLHPARSDATHG